MAFDRELLHPWSGERHVNNRSRAEFTRSERNTLRVVARRGGDYARSQFIRAELCHEVIGTAPFVGVDGRQVFALYEDFYVGVFQKN